MSGLTWSERARPNRIPGESSRRGRAAEEGVRHRWPGPAPAVTPLGGGASRRDGQQSRARPVDRAAGWTLIELMVVISLITILAGIALANYRNSIIRAQEATLKENLFRMRDAIDQYYADKGVYPPSLDALVSEGYLRRIPIDPFTDSADTWQTVLAEPDPNNPTAESGIFDVKSGSDRTALDGSKYADW
jgi:general secretion pathway protein G